MDKLEKSFLMLVESANLLKDVSEGNVEEVSSVGLKQSKGFVPLIEAELIHYATIFVRDLKGQKGQYQFDQKVVSREFDQLKLPMGTYGVQFFDRLSGNTRTDGRGMKVLSDKINISPIRWIGKMMIHKGAIYAHTIAGTALLKKGDITIDSAKVKYTDDREINR